MAFQRERAGFIVQDALLPSPSQITHENHNVMIGTEFLRGLVTGLIHRRLYDFEKLLLRYGAAGFHDSFSDQIIEAALLPLLEIRIELLSRGSGRKGEETSKYRWHVHLHRSTLRKLKLWITFNEISDILPWTPLSVQIATAMGSQANFSGYILMVRQASMTTPSRIAYQRALPAIMYSPAIHVSNRMPIWLRSMMTSPSKRSRGTSASLSQTIPRPRFQSPSPDTKVSLALPLR